MLFITAEGDVEEIKVKDFKEFYALLNCSLVQAIHLPAGRTMWIDEEGKFKPHARNTFASILLLNAGGMPDDYVAGAAIITDKGEIE
jgi:hypothetical protein